MPKTNRKKTMSQTDVAIYIKFHDSWRKKYGYISSKNILVFVVPAVDFDRI